MVASALPHTNEFLGDRAYFIRARDQRRFAVGEYQIGRVSGKASVNLAYPVDDLAGQSLVGVVFVALDLEGLNQLAARADLREGETLTVVDRQGTVLVHYGQPGHIDLIGRSLAGHDPVRRMLDHGTETKSMAKGPDGVMRLYASTPLRRTGGLADAHVFVGIPVDEAYAAANRMLAQSLGFLGVVSVLAFVAAWAFGDFFVLRQVRGLVQAAQRLRHGDLSARSGVSHSTGELGDLARGFDEMAVALEQRVEDLQKTKEELKRLNEELEQRVIERTLELKRSNEDLEQFAYVASHDLQEPLRMITSYMQLLKQRYSAQLDRSGNEFVDFALDGATRMQRLITDLLAYSRVGTRGQPFESVDLGEIVRRTLQNLEVAVQETGAQVTTDALPTVAGDPVQLTQLFQNLVANALKFRGESRPRVHITAERNGTAWHLRVRDNGIGISSQDFERIFVIFQRLHHRDKYTGTGIGLAICKKIVERHGGRIWVESSPGHGTTFHFTLASGRPE
jgi:signal transduction histidine kinase